MRTIVVTGGASGIGAACAEHFARDGWRVVIADIADAAGEALAQRLGAPALYRRMDVTDEAAVEAACAAIWREAGRVDALVNSAGLLQGATRVTEMAIPAFDAILAVNLRGAMLACRGFGSRMAAQGSGAIVNICSIASLRASPQPAYAASKAALAMLTEILAAELGPQGVRVNAVAPGYTMTALMHSLIESGQRDPAAVVERTPLRRFVAPAEVAAGIAFLCSDAASAITGAILPIDCGWLAGSSYKAYATQPG
jgi:NAD(P)-dependent dehydrogenase (short-subunit alcohol dehydrogenase family)